MKPFENQTKVHVWNEDAGAVITLLWHKFNEARNAPTTTVSARLPRPGQGANHLVANNDV